MLAWACCERQLCANGGFGSIRIAPPFSHSIPTSNLSRPLLRCSPSCTCAPQPPRWTQPSLPTAGDVLSFSVEEAMNQLDQCAPAKLFRHCSRNAGGVETGTAVLNP